MIGLSTGEATERLARFGPNASIGGPGWLAIAAGLAMLAGDFQWARRLLDGLKMIPRRIDPRE